MNAMIKNTFFNYPIIKKQVETDKDNFKSVAKFLCKSYREKMISDEIFEEFIKILLASYIEKSAEDLISLPLCKKELKFYNQFSNWINFGHEHSN
ncbi:MAG: hypothetical protein ABIJ31_03775 [Pseudomonadota bacterium]